MTVVDELSPLPTLDESFATPKVVVSLDCPAGFSVIIGLRGELVLELSDGLKGGFVGGAKDVLSVGLVDGVLKRLFVGS